MPEDGPSRSRRGRETMSIKNCLQGVSIGETPAPWVPLPAPLGCLSGLDQVELELEGDLGLDRRDRDLRRTDAEVRHPERGRAHRLNLAAADLELDGQLDRARDSMDGQLAGDGHGLLPAACQAGRP